jgi:hypothetical protein
MVDFDSDNRGADSEYLYIDSQYKDEENKKVFVLSKIKRDKSSGNRK